ncbi:MAG: hypothetical protein US54_C0011G0003 [Candidatus Roizmanbacteria bacterium GW2011_GWA2_37_7]|uniref:Membrane protein 6-pyruvoyl-tetrahydropterin synthase-related domain-containing protein n=1 Tax=Candidatus Roizmanbacteria bacterium GW2011_GWA2_37_7 TaxID=1618481 RepID=A0A0G0H8A4_9BACT|nr:MAG: hypothetical protein US54_C0011G0003 [Candidatus Roizmanbacteria bacterium GW2011_GWA2_37_7]
MFDLFVHTGRPVTFDGPTHIANMAQVYEGLKDGDFPVRWGAGWARYGWPAPLFAQQVPSYTGAILNFISRDIVTSYNIAIFLGALLSTYLLYIFLRFYVGFIPALLGATVFHFAPYRIINIYVRGALPEFYASIFIISILISLYLALEKKKLFGYLLLAISVCMLLLTHPFMMVVGSIFFVPYGSYLVLKDRNYVFQKILGIGVMVGFGVGLSAYYLVPLFYEVKYLYYGSSNLHYASGNLLTLERFFIDSWPYFTSKDIAPRGHVLVGGVLEGIILFVSIIYVSFRYIKYKKLELLLFMITIVGITYIFFMLPPSDIFYQKIVLLGNIQHPWRMLTGYIFVPPILLASFVEKFRYKKIFFIVVIFVVALLRFPQLYGKNYTMYPQESYFITDDNMHGTILNTVWMGEVRDYPYQKEKVAILDGQGKMSGLQISNSSRSFTVQADTELNVVDYTFYFPGWRAYIDGDEIPIQFQDPAQRGVITYKVPSGNHLVSVIFTRTKPRILGDVISIASLILLISLYTLRKRVSSLAPYAS